MFSIVDDVADAEDLKLQPAPVQGGAAAVLPQAAVQTQRGYCQWSSRVRGLHTQE